MFKCPEVPDVLLGLLSCFCFFAKLSAKRLGTNNADTLSTHVWVLWEHIIPSERRLTSRPLMADGNKVCVHSEFARDTRALFSDMNTHMTSCFINLLTTDRRVFSLTHHLWSKLINLVWTSIIFFHTGDIIESRWYWVFLINKMLGSKCLQRYNSWFSELVKCSFAKGSHLNKNFKYLKCWVDYLLNKCRKLGDWELGTIFPYDLPVCLHHIAFDIKLSIFRLQYIYFKVLR